MNRGRRRTLEKLHSEEASEASLCDERALLLRSLLSGRRLGLGEAGTAAEDDRAGLVCCCIVRDDSAREDCCCCLVVVTTAGEDASSKSLKSMAVEDGVA